MKKNIVTKFLLGLTFFFSTTLTYSQIVHFGEAYRKIELDVGEVKGDLINFELRVRKVIVPEEKDSFFVVVVRKGKTSTHRNYISEDEFRDLVQAVNVFYDTIGTDLKLGATYVEHIFSTTTGIDFGYGIGDSEPYFGDISKEFAWFIRYENSMEVDTYKLKKVNVKELFGEVLERMEELRGLK